MPTTKQTEKKWYAVDLVVDSSAREASEYGLMEAGALGTETRDGDEGQFQVTGYFETAPDREFVRAQLADALRVYELLSSTVREMDLRRVADRDWLAEWKKSWQPLEIGRFVIAPPWNQPEVGSDQILITIEPGMAFGTGTHETTRLCLAAMERLYEGGSFLDVGTGTGILAIAAAKLFPHGSVTAFDTDSEAITIAKENAALNGVGQRITFHTGTIDNSSSSANMVCANLTAEVILELLPQLLGVTCRRLVLSGILEAQVPAVVERARQCGAPDPIEITSDGEWSAIIL